MNRRGRTVELQGGSCARYREGNHLLEAPVQCDVVRPETAAKAVKWASRADSLV